MVFESRLHETFDAIVTGAGQKGTWVRLLHPPVEGKLIKGKKGLDVGDRLQVQLIKVDVVHGHIDFVKAKDQESQPKEANNHHNNKKKNVHQEEPSQQEQ